MSTRLARTADRTWMAILWQTTALNAAARWPEPYKLDYSQADALRDIGSKGQRVHVRVEQDGFFIVHAGFLPERPSTRSGDGPGGLAAELAVWLWTPGLTEAEQRPIFADLMRGWFEDELKRGEHEYAFGEVPDTIAPIGLKLLDDWTINVTPYDRRGHRCDKSFQGAGRKI